MTRPSRPRRPSRAPALVALAVALVAAACGGDTEGGGSPTTVEADGTTTPPGMVAQVASYEVVAGRPGRFLVGLLAADQSKLVSFGTVELRFGFLASGEQQAQPQGTAVTATFLPIPGQTVDPAAKGPRFVEASEGIGVYAAPDVKFDYPGNWQVTAKAVLDGEEATASGAFEVLGSSPIPAPGDAAPRTDNPLVGAAGVPPKAIDSRASDTKAPPDPELHATSVKAALDAKKPVMVVVSTPTYCQSRFCGPITDSVAALVPRYGDRMAFVHLEVWRDFDNQELNKSAAEWIYPPGTKDPREPWVFVVGTDGKIVQRFDNVASEAELDAAAKAVAG